MAHERKNWCISHGYVLPFSECDATYLLQDLNFRTILDAMPHQWHHSIVECGECRNVPRRAPFISTDYRFNAAL